MADLRMGIVGIGNMGSAHFNYVNSGKIEGMTLSAVCDLRQERLDYCKENAPGVSCYTDWQELVKDPNVDAIIIAVPHPLHADIAMAALNAGKHVLTEKPVDVRISKAQALNECAAKSGKVFGIVFECCADAFCHTCWLCGGNRIQHCGWDICPPVRSRRGAKRCE